MYLIVINKNTNDTNFCILQTIIYITNIYLYGID